MPSLATTKMSSKGQIVIPEIIRKRLGLKAGAQFVVVSGGDVVILKVIKPPSMSEFDNLIKKARLQAKKAGLKRKDVDNAIKQVRKESEDHP